MSLSYIFSHRKKERKNKAGFTLAELLIVVAIIAVLVAISIPVFSAQLHKARVAADWANIRSYFSEIQADYISTGKHNPNVPDGLYTAMDYTTINFLNGQKVKLKAGIYMVTYAGNKGYQISYACNKSHPSCALSLNVN